MKCSKRILLILAIVMLLGTSFSSIGDKLIMQVLATEGIQSTTDGGEVSTNVYVQDQYNIAKYENPPSCTILKCNYPDWNNGYTSTIDIPDTISGYEVKNIAESAFSDVQYVDNKKITIKIPNSIESIDSDAFIDTPWLKEIIIKNGEGNWYRDDGGVLYEKYYYGSWWMHTYPASKPEWRYDIPSWCCYVGEDAFSCPNFNLKYLNRMG